MAEYRQQHWISDGSGITRKQRQSCQYETYIPDALSGRGFVFDGDVAADIADAEAAIIRLNESASVLSDTEALARLLLCAESVASSRIEGLVVGSRRLLEADARRRWDVGGRQDVTAEEVLGNIDAMQSALDVGASEEPISMETIEAIHARLCSGTHLAPHGGRLRTEQNWIGGNRFNPCGAQFVPPPHDLVRQLMSDLCDFCNEDSLPAVAQAAIAHAQFETIHPFVDGNGRVGRALVHAVLRRRGLAQTIVPPVSLILATLHQDYILALTEFRHVGSADTAAANQGVNAWVAFFAGSCTRAVNDAQRFEANIAKLTSDWRVRLGAVRRNSSLDLAVGVLPGAPVVTVKGLASIIGRSFEAASGAIDRLVGAGILTPVGQSQRYRVYEAREVIDAFTLLERQFASPAGNTATAAPARPVPQRPR